MSSPSFQFCGDVTGDNDPEVFFGEVSAREKRKASKYDRRTIVYKSGFRSDQNLMRYTMDQLQMLALRENSRTFGSEGTESCESGSPLGSVGSSESQGESPVPDSGVDSPPVFSRAQLNSWIRRSGFGDLIGKVYPTPGDSGVYEDSPRSEAFGDSAISSPDCVATPPNFGIAPSSFEPSVAQDSMDTDEQVPHRTEQSFQHRQSSEASSVDQDILTRPIGYDTTPSNKQGFAVTSDCVNSPLLNTASDGQNLCSPRHILGDVQTVCDSSVTYSNVFSGCIVEEQPTSLLRPRHSVQSGTQEVPSCATPEGQGQSELYLDESFGHCSNLPEQISRHSTVADRSLVFHPDDGGDVSIVTMGSVMEESMLDCSRRTFRFSTSEDECNLSADESRTVPEYNDSPGANCPVNLLKSRPGVTFTEKQFSPTLTVRTSPPRDPEHDEIKGPKPRLLNAKSLFLDLNNQDADLSIEEGLVPESPECLSEVMFSMTVNTPPPPSPKKGKVKRLSPVKNTKGHDEPKPSGSVYGRLYGLKNTPDVAGKPSSRPSSVKGAPASNKAETLRRAHSASKLDSTGESRPPFYTPASNPGSARRGLFSHHKTPSSVDKKFSHHTPSKQGKDTKCTPSTIKTTGTVNRQAICQATAASRVATSQRSGPKTTPKLAPSKTTPRSGAAKVTPKTGSKCGSSAKLTPGKARATPVKAMSGGVLAGSSHKLPPPVYKRGTPRFPKDSCLATGPKRTPVLEPMLPAPDFNDSINEADLSTLDNSILLQEKKVELERLHLEKIKLQKQKNKQKPKGSQSPRLPLLPTTADNLPKVRFNNKQALDLSEPELDAITLVHTLCNSQQVAKIVTKPRASNGVRHSNTPSKPASKLQWNETLTTAIDEELETDCDQEQASSTEGRRRSILTVRIPGHHFPYYDQPQSPVVVTKGNRKFTGFGKEPSNLI